MTQPLAANDRFGSSIERAARPMLTPALNRLANDLDGPFAPQPEEFSSTVARPREQKHNGGDSEAAIARVLDAERGARAAVGASQREAEAIRAAARARESRIAKTAATRRAAIHAAMTERRAARLAAIEAEGAAPDPHAAADEAARAHLDRAVARLADEMIGGEAAQ